MEDATDNLIKQAQGGDREAFASLLAAHYDIMFRMALKWCGRRADAEDITQTACIKLARVIGSYRFEAAFTSWLYRVVINTAIDWRAGQGTEPWDDGVLDLAAPGNGEDALQARQMLGQVLRLPEREKTALLLVFSEGLSHAEAAFVMKCRESTVSGYIHTARKRLGVVVSEKKGRFHG